MDCGYIFPLIHIVKTFIKAAVCMAVMVAIILWVFCAC